MSGKKLGRGLNSLIEETVEESSPVGEDGRSVPCIEILPNPYQPRRVFDEGSLAELVASIREHGVLQPVVVRRQGDRYELVAGERRWRACQRAGLERIPVVVREVDDERMLEVALVENLQREDLNPIEKARAYRRYVEELGLTHQAAGERLGKDRSSITNQLRLLELAEDLQEMVSRGTLSMGHARALLSVEDEEARRELAELVERDGLSVREVERRARKGKGEPPSREPRDPTAGNGRPAQMEQIERRLRERFATKARIEGGREKGRIQLEYYSLAELNRLLELLLPDAEF